MPRWIPLSLMYYFSSYIAEFDLPIFCLEYLNYFLEGYWPIILFSCNVLSAFGVMDILVSQNELETFLQSDFLSFNEINIIYLIIGDRICR